MNILITDYHCASNRGDAAILEGELAALSKQFPTAEFTVMTDYPDASDLIHNIESIEQKISSFDFCDFPKNTAILLLLLDAWKPGKKLSIPKIRQIKDRLNIEPYENADIVISTGGQFITDAYFPNKISVLAELYMCKLLNKKVIIYGQTLGPFDKTPYKGLIRRVLNSLDLIITRDELSILYLDQLGVDNPPIHPQADAAFTMPLNTDRKPLQRKIGTEIPTFNKSEGPIISISTRDWSHFNSEKSEKRYWNAIVETADYFIEEYDAKIIFASTCTGLAGYHTDDRISGHRISQMSEYYDTDSIEILSSEYTPQQLVEIFRQVDTHIGTRMHSNILAILAETPVVPIEYQFKTTGLMQMFELEDTVLDIENMSSEQLLNATEEIFNKRDKYTEKIQKHLPDVKKKSSGSAILIQDFLQTH